MESKLQYIQSVCAVFLYRASVSVPAFASLPADLCATSALQIKLCILDVYSAFFQHLQDYSHCFRLFEQMWTWYLYVGADGKQ